MSFLRMSGAAVSVPSYCDHTVCSASGCELSHNETVCNGNDGLRHTAWLGLSGVWLVKRTGGVRG